MHYFLAKIWLYLSFIFQPSIGRLFPRSDFFFKVCRLIILDFWLRVYFEPIDVGFWGSLIIVGFIVGLANCFLDLFVVGC